MGPWRWVRWRSLRVEKWSPRGAPRTDGWDGEEPEDHKWWQTISIKIYIRWNIEHFLEAIRLFQSAGCVRNKLPFLIVQRKLRWFLVMQVYAWMVSQLWMFGIWLWKCFIPPNTNSVKPKVYLYRGTCCPTPHQTSARETKPKLQPSTTCAFECEIFSIQRYVLCFQGFHTVQQKL